MVEELLRLPCKHPGQMPLFACPHPHSTIYALSFNSVPYDDTLQDLIGLIFFVVRAEFKQVQAVFDGHSMPGCHIGSDGIKVQLLDLVLTEPGVRCRILQSLEKHLYFSTHGAISGVSENKGCIRVVCSRCESRWTITKSCLL